MSRNRVLIVVENCSVPSDFRVWHEACSLRDAGYRVTVLCPRSGDSRKGYEVLDGITIYRYPSRGDGKSQSGMVAEYCFSLLWQAVYSLWIYLRRGFDVIQGCNPPDTIVFIALPYKLFGVKYIFDQHDAVPELYEAKYRKKGFFYAVQMWLERVTFHYSDVSIATNESYREIAVRRGSMDPRNVFVVRNGPDLEVFKPVEPNPRLKHGRRYLVAYVGLMAVQDGLDMLLDVILYLKQRGRQDVHFTCLGKGPERDRLRQRAKDVGVEEMVEFPGFVPRSRLLEILSTADVCVNPDIPCEMNNISTMIKVLEYMAFGKPIVQCDFREGRASAKEASLYADTRNPVPDFGEKIIWLLDNPEERRRMGEFGRRRMEEALEWRHSVPNLLAAYKRVFEKNIRVPAVGRGVVKGAEREEGPVVENGCGS